MCETRDPAVVHVRVCGVQGSRVWVRGSGLRVRGLGWGFWVCARVSDQELGLGINRERLLLRVENLVRQGLGYVGVEVCETRDPTVVHVRVLGFQGLKGSDWDFELRVSVPEQGKGFRVRIFQGCFHVAVSHAGVIGL